MTSGRITEGVLEEATLDWFRALGYATLTGPTIAPDGPAPERSTYADVVLMARPRDAVRRINPDQPSAVVEQAITRLLRPESQNTLAENERVHRMLTQGVPVEHRVDGAVRTTLVWLVDWEHPDVNDWLVVNQLTVVEAGRNRRPDLVVHLNGLPVAVLELKNPGDRHATLKGAWHQVQTYRADIGSIFVANAVTVISEGTSATMGPLHRRARALCDLGRVEQHLDRLARTRGVPTTARRCAACSTLPRVGSSSPRSRSSPPRREVTRTPCSPTGATSS